MQEYLQKNGEISIVYELIKFEGPPHRRKFYTKLIIDNKEISSGEGYSKKESEQDAAKSSFCFATGIAVKVPPKNDTSIMEFLVSIVSK